MHEKRLVLFVKSAQLQGYMMIFFLFFAFSHLHAQNLEKGVSFSQHKFLPCYNLKKTSNTSIFQGNNKKRKYFEGWYFKMVAEDGSSIFSVIPGISLSSDGKEQHAFIQLINGVTAQTSYYTFPVTDFLFSTKDFAIRIGNNYFSREMIILDIQDSSSIVSGKIEMFNSIEYKSGKLFNPGIMGWYRFVPFMQCYHGVVSLTNELKGMLIVDNEIHDFNRGKGYIEKDWGSSMPSAWIWMQSNHFNNTNSSFMLSIADIPWLGKSFTGFLGFFYYNNQIHHFATYRNSKLKLEVDDHNLLKISIENRDYTFFLHAMSNNSGLLKAPNKGSMNRRIPESIDARLKIKVVNKQGETVFFDSTNIAGLEMVGAYSKLQGLLK